MTTQVNVRVDDMVKRRAEQACAAIGMSMSTAINVFLVKLGNEMRIPFEVSADPFYSSSNLKHLDEIYDDMKNGRNMSVHDLIEVD